MISYIVRKRGGEREGEKREMEEGEKTDGGMEIGRKKERQMGKG